MTAPVRTARLQNSVTGLPAEDERLITAFFTPGTGLHSRTGIWPAAAGYVGEVVLLSDTQIQTNPFRATIAGSQSGVQGDYTVANDAVRTTTIGARDAANTRLDLLVTRVRDTGYTPNEGANDVRYAEVIPGTPAASPVTPAVPANALVHGTITVPKVGGAAVTYASAPPGYVVALGGVRPAVAADVAAPLYDGQTRWHPTTRLEVGVGGIWEHPAPAGLVSEFTQGVPSSATSLTTYARITGTINGQCNLRTGRVYRARFTANYIASAAGPNAAVVQLTIADAGATPVVCDPALAVGGFYAGYAATGTALGTIEGLFRVNASKAYSFSPWLRQAAITGRTGTIQASTPGSGVNDVMLLEVIDLGSVAFVTANTTVNLGTIPLITV
jgi:hypothetical protein